MHKPLGHLIAVLLLAAALPLPAVRAATTPAANTDHHAITDIDFRRDKTGTAWLTVTFQGSRAAISVKKQQDGLTATLPHSQAPACPHKHLDVRDFDTPARTIDITCRHGGVQIAVTTAHKRLYRHKILTPDNRIKLALIPREQAATGPRQDATAPYTGKHISLSFQKIGVRAALQLIADAAHVNIVVADGVSGELSLQLDDVPWDQALHVILQSRGLAMQRIGNVINIAPLATIAKRRQARLQANQTTHELAPLQSTIIQLKYADAETISALLESGDQHTALVSSRGHVIANQRTNSVLVTDTAAHIDDIKRVIQRLDIPVRQVLVEARIVVANRDFSRELGVTQAVHNRATVSPSASHHSYTIGSGFTVNLPIADAAGAITTSILGNSFSLNLALSALESENRGKVVSAPRVITTDGQKAVIEQGQKVPYVTKQGNDSPATTAFKEVVLHLAVTPHITPDDQVLLNLELIQDNVSGWAKSGQPIIDTRNLSTQVLVHDGNTVVLGGIYQRQSNNAESHVPILGDVPIIGRLFSSTQRKHSRFELLLFITPRILEHTAASG